MHPKVVRGFSAFPYCGWVSEAIHGVKYQGERDRALFLGSVLAASRAAELIRLADIVVSVPAFPRRERERGYNQAQLIAERACAVVGVSPPMRVLVQATERPSQVGLGASARRTNMRGAFAIDPGVALRPGLRIVVVDDVRTTGSTLMACVDALQRTRPGRVDIITLAAELPENVMESIGLNGKGSSRS